MSDKTEEPTPRRLTRAIEQGDVPVSGALVSACAFLAVALALPSLGTFLVGWVTGALRRAPSAAPGDLALSALEALALGVAPSLLCAAAVAALLGAVQARGVFAPQKVAPDLSRLGKGLGSLVDASRLLSLLRGLLTAAAVAWLCKSRAGELLGALALTAGEPAKTLSVLLPALRGLVRDVGFLLLLSAVVDLGLVLRSWRSKLKMSPDEVKREARESEGDPQLKAARERAHHELLAQASVNAVKDATVVVVNPTHLAAALRYREGDDEAPTILAKGDGALAARIVEAARAYNIPVVQDVPLARALHELEVGDQIPESLYEAVAEILKSLWDAESRTPHVVLTPPPLSGNTGEGGR